MNLGGVGVNVEELEVKILKALAHPIRLKIVKKLRNGTLCVCDLNTDVEFSQSNLSQHLRILRDADIVTYEREGTKILYSIKNEEIIKLIDIVEKIIFNEITEMSKNIRS